MNSQPQPAPSAATRDQQIRAALDQHWAASNANDSETEHLIYHDDAVLDYPQSGERTRGRANIQKQRSIQPNQKRFTIRRVVGSGDLWVTEYILSYDNKPSYTVSIMEFSGLKVAHETQYFADPFSAPAFRARILGSQTVWDGAALEAHSLLEVTRMDWKQLVQLVLLGIGGLEQYAILLVRISIGLFFAISGANKLFTAGAITPVYETLVKSKAPFPRQTAYFVAAVEFVCGSLLTVGLLSSFACVALLIDMTVAILTNALATLPKGLSPLNWLDDFLYLPEVLYVLFFIWLICSGPGKFSVDHWLAGKLLG